MEYAKAGQSPGLRCGFFSSKQETLLGKEEEGGGRVVLIQDKALLGTLVQFRANVPDIAPGGHSQEQN